MNYDTGLVSMKDDFRLVIDSVLKKMFKVNLDDTDVKRIYVDINSALSILFRYDDIADEKLLQIISDVIENFIVEHLENGLTIYFLYTLKPSRVHRSIYPGWCKEREDRVSIVKSDYLKKLIVTFKIYSDKNNNVKVVNCEDIHPALVVYEIDRVFRNGSLILSKDLVFRCFSKTSVKLYNGVEWIDFEQSIFKQPDDVKLLEPHTMLAYYLALRGDSRNEYKGQLRFGPVNSAKYIEVNRLKIRAGVEHPQKEFLDKHIALFDIEKMREKAKELGIDLSRFSK
ncbi:MAG: hypothetical protein ACRCX2_24915 [Paraclostridium sp.]